MPNRSCAWACVLLLAGAWPVRGKEAPRDRADSDVVTQQAAIERVLTVIDLVQAHHISPPSRQEMLVELAKTFTRSRGTSRAAELAARTAECRTREEEATFLNWLCSEAKLRFKGPGGRAAPLEELRHQALSENPLQSSVQPILKAKRKKEFEAHQTLESSIHGLVPDGLQLISAKEAIVQEQFRGNSYVGIGVALGSDEETGQPTIRSLLPNSLAKEAGANDGDIIESINDEPMKGLSIAQVVDRIRGPKGTRVTLVVRQPKAENSRTLAITRGVIRRNSILGWTTIGDGTPLFRVGPNLPIVYVQISAIDASVVNDLQQLEQRWQREGIRALVIDLRDVMRGSPHNAALLADALLDGGTIGRVRTKAGSRVYAADRECLFREWPLAVLVDEKTGSTAEWVAAALQDNRRAVIVGHSTRGQAFVHSTVPTPYANEVLELATGVMERPSGTSLVRPSLLQGQNPPYDNASVTAKDWYITPDEIVEPYLNVGRTGDPRQIPASLLDPHQAHELALNKACEILHKQLEARREADKP